MSLHTQLLRGLFALPVLLLLAVASVTAPARPRQAPAEAAAHARAIIIVVDDRMAVVTHAADDAP